MLRSKVEPTGFEIYVADPLAGQVAEQARLLIQGRNALVVVRLRIDCGKILEIEQLYDRNINDAAFPLLTTPRPGLVNDVPPSERASREVLIRAATLTSTRSKAMPARSALSPKIASAMKTATRR